jgi:hypothetical protein
MALTLWTFREGRRFLLLDLSDLSVPKNKTAAKGPLFLRRLIGTVSRSVKALCVLTARQNVKKSIL